MGAKSVWVSRVCICEGQSTKRSPQRERSVLGPWGLSRGIIDDVFITRCGVTWGLGHSMSVCECMWECVLWGWAGWLSCLLFDTEDPVIGVSLFFQMFLVWIHKSRLSKTQTITHCPKPNPFPELNSLKQIKMLKIRRTHSLVSLRHSVSSQCHARPLADLSVCLSSHRTSLKSLMRWRLRFWLPLRLN